MLKKALLALLLVICIGPAASLVAVGLLMNPAANAQCLPGTSVTVGDVPDSLTVTTKNGETLTLNRQQLTHAATIITIGSQTEGITTRGITIALMAALTESNLRQLANTSTYPESGNYSNDGNGSDHDSLGLFQMRPQSGWGSVAELMDPTYQAEAFYGGPTGPNHPSPRGLLDIPGWEDMDMGEAAQAVEVSAYPDRYHNYHPVAETILTTLTHPSTGGGDNGGTPAVPETTQVVFPLPEGTWTRTSGYGMRVHPITGEAKLHTGVDYAAADGTPILAVADGTVTVAEYGGGYGGLVVIEHTVNRQLIATAYAHSWQTGIHVTPGQSVRAGDHIADVGSSGRSTGPHLHFEVRPGGTDQPAIDPEPWLEDQDLTQTTPPEPGTAGCEATPDGDAQEFTGDGDEMVPDPTGTGGQVTARTAHMVAQTQAAFPDTGWACYSPRPGSKSDHPLGRACDVTVGNQIGHYPTDTQTAYGWQVTDWLEANAERLGVTYLIWQGKMWSLARADEGWRPYTGGGMHDPADVTGGHFDHVHISVKDG